MVWKGLRFGLFLQLAIGPVWLFIFQTAGTQGFWAGMSAMVAAALIDALYIALSGLGVAAVIEKPKVKQVLKIVGCVVLLIFGLSSITGAFGISLLPSFKLFAGMDSNTSAFLHALVLTASSPLTILLWSGIFSTKVVELNLNRKQIFFYGLGCLCATPIGQTCTSILGSVFHRLFPAVIIQALNVFVGVMLIFFGIRMVLKKD